MTTRASRLRRKLEAGPIVLAPGIYDLISARLADRMGFDALYMTGYGTVASHLGLPDAGLATYSEMVERVTQICDRTSTPLVADADTGYGGLLNVRRTVQGYEKGGACAIQIEDQETPKKCGHTTGRRVVETSEMVAKVRVAVEARNDPDTLIIARSDARTALGLDEALRRGEAYARAGADIVFIESPESEDELRRIGEALKGVWLVANVVQAGGRTPELHSTTLQALGFSLAIYPGLGFKAAAAAIASAYTHLQREHTGLGLKVPMMTSNEMHELMGFPDVWAFEKHCDALVAEGGQAR